MEELRAEGGQFDKVMEYLSRVSSRKEGTSSQPRRSPNPKPTPRDAASTSSSSSEEEEEELAAPSLPPTSSGRVRKPSKKVAS